MTDKEITEILAKTMGWKMCPHMENVSRCWCGKCDPFERDLIFSPLTSDSDCMMVWDKFSIGKESRIERLSDGHWVADAGKGSWSYSLDRKSAMCECMVKAVIDKDTTKLSICSYCKEIMPFEKFNRNGKPCCALCIDIWKQPSSSDNYTMGVDLAENYENPDS